MIAPHISIIFNSSLASGIFSDDWKSATVTPPFEQGERNYIDNYPPISVISITGSLTRLLTDMFLRHLVILLVNLTFKPKFATRYYKILYIGHYMGY